MHNRANLCNYFLFSTRTYNNYADYVVMKCALHPATFHYPCTRGSELRIYYFEL